MPYFDYIFTILCYFSKEAIQKLSNCFYICIFKLLKIKLNFNDFNEINNILEKYGLFAFQHRALESMLNFSYKIINFSKSPPNLREQFVKNKARSLNYNLRNENNFVETAAKTRNGEKTFGFFYTRMANKFVVEREGLKISSFKNSIFNNINLIYNETLKIFDKFNLNFKFCFFVFWRIYFITFYDILYTIFLNQINEVLIGLNSEKGTSLSINLEIEFNWKIQK